MLKEVGASGQISLGKKYAGQLFDLQFHGDGRVEMRPMKAVPDSKPYALNTDDLAAVNAAEEPRSKYGAAEASTAASAPVRGDGWLTPERLARRKAAAERPPAETERLMRQWEAENKDAIEAMNERYRKVGSMGMRIYEWRKQQADQAKS